MMKGLFKNKAQKAFLTAAISLALAGSAFAMPQGGEVKSGTVNISGVTTAANGTINVTGLGLVDWQSFDLNKGETLTFILKDQGDVSANIINRVVGKDMSEIYGNMISQGEGGVYLINPNGIVIGNGAQIDVGSLMLSTMKFTETDATKILDVLNKGGTWTLQANPNAAVKIESGAKINFYDFLALMGGKVQIADNVTISDGLKRAGVEGGADYSQDVTFDVIAANQAKLNFELTKDKDNNPDGVELGNWSVSAGTGNDITMGKANITVGGSVDSYIAGNTVTMTNTNLDLTPSNTEKYSTALEIVAAKALTDNNGQVIQADAANKVSLDGATAKATYVLVGGGNVALKDASVSKVAGVQDEDEKNLFDDSIRLLAGTKATISDDSKNEASLEATKDTAVMVTGGSLDSTSNISAYGGAVTLDGVTTKSTGYTDLIAGKTIGYSRVWNEKENNYDDGGSLTASPSNTVVVKGAGLTAGDGMVVYGGKVDVSDSTLMNMGTNGEIELDALNVYQSVDDANDPWEATTDNTVTVANSKLANTGTSEEEDNEIQLQGGAVTVSGSTMQAKNILMTSRSHDAEDADSSTNYATTGMDTKVTDSTLTADEEVLLTGKTITLDGTTTLKAGNGTVLAAGSETTYKEVEDEALEITVKDGTNVKLGKNVTIDGDSIIKPGKEVIEDSTKPTEPTTPDPVADPEIEKNIVAGKTDMTKALADNATNQTATVAQLAQKLSDKSDMTDMQKAAQLKGYLDAIEEGSASATEAQALQRTALRTVEGTAAADDHAKDKQTEAAGSSQEAIADTTAVAADVPAAADASAEAATVTVDGEEQE